MSAATRNVSPPNRNSPPASPTSLSTGGRRNSQLSQTTAELIKALPKAAVCGLACEAAAYGDVEGVKVLIKAGVSMNVGTPYDKRTPLHLAAASGDAYMVQFLIEECKAILARDRFGLMPINDAAQNGHTEVRRYLQKINLDKVKQEQAGGRRRGSSVGIGGLVQDDPKELMGTVFELVTKEGVFSHTTVYSEVSHFFMELGLHSRYFSQFTPSQIAKHVHCLIAAKRVAQATGDATRLDFELATGVGGVFLTSVGRTVPTDAQKRTETKVAKHMDLIWADRNNVNMCFVSSSGPIHPGGTERLGIFSTEKGTFDVQHISDDETSLHVLASARFLKEKTKAVVEQYQIIMEDTVAAGQATVHIVPGTNYPGMKPDDFVFIFATPETIGRTYFNEIFQALHFMELIAERLYVETFANGVITYTIFVDSIKEHQLEGLRRAVMFSTLLKTSRGSDQIYTHVMGSEISFEAGLYLAATVKFVYAFFPKEDYAPEYTSVHKVLEMDPTSQMELEALYKLCLRDLLSTGRIHELLNKNKDLAVMLFDDFRRIVTGKVKPAYNNNLAMSIDKACSDAQDRQILKMFLVFNESVLLTNFFKSHTPGAFAFRLNPAVVLRGRPATMYPEIPYGMYFVSGRDFQGFHIRFRDVARGGIRLITSRDQAAYERNVASLFDECYNLAFTQQMKNKDLPEGGSKGVILADQNDKPLDPARHKAVFTKYFDALLDCMMPEQSGIFAGHMDGRTEMLYFGPDENTAGFMDLGAEIGRMRGYQFWMTLTTGKSVKYGGVPHDVYGMTTASVHKYVTELLKKLGENEEDITKFQTGGPDGDLGSNEILVSKDKTIGIADGSGVIYDPTGLDRTELVRLAKGRTQVKAFSRNLIGPDGFLVLCEDKNINLPDGSVWETGLQLRDVFHLTSYATADLFVPCGGRPNAVTQENIKYLFNDAGKPKFRIIVEGANVFFTDSARATLEDAGVHLFKDASTNKGGVSSSSLEVLAGLALPDEEYSRCMTFNPDATAEPPVFYATYVRQIMSIVTENARQEFEAIWATNQAEGIPKVQCTRLLSGKINQVSDRMQDQLKSGMAETERTKLVRAVMSVAVPSLLVDRLGVGGLIQHLPENYIGAVVSAYIASRFVYRYGIDASEVSFFFFLREMFDIVVKPDPPQLKRERPAWERAGEAPNDQPADPPPLPPLATPEELKDQPESSDSDTASESTNTGGERKADFDDANDDGVMPHDIDMVVSQAGCTPVEAIRALKAKNNDVLEAILHLSQK